LTSDELIALLELEPLAGEGGYFRQTYRSLRVVSDAAVARPLGTCIYYLLTPESFSAFHRLSADEIFHFYLGDPVEHVRLALSGTTITTLGQNVEKGECVQLIVPAGVWQAARLMPGGSWALMGTTMCPGFADEDHIIGKRDELIASFPEYKELITELTR